jgi:hypothetical protein
MMHESVYMCVKYRVCVDRVKLLSAVQWGNPESPTSNESKFYKALRHPAKLAAPAALSRAIVVAALQPFSAARLSLVCSCRIGADVLLFTASWLSGFFWACV